MDDSLTNIDLIYDYTFQVLISGKSEIFKTKTFLSCWQYLETLNSIRFKLCLFLSWGSQKSTKTFSIESPHQVIVHCSRVSIQIYQKSNSVKEGVVKGGVASDVSAQHKSFEISTTNGQTVRPLYLQELNLRFYTSMSPSQEYFSFVHLGVVTEDKQSCSFKENCCKNGCTPQNSCVSMDL